MSVGPQHPALVTSLRVGQRWKQQTCSPQACCLETPRAKSQQEGQRMCAACHSRDCWVSLRSMHGLDGTTRKYFSSKLTTQIEKPALMLWCRRGQDTVYAGLARGSCALPLFSLSSGPRPGLCHLTQELSLRHLSASFFTLLSENVFKENGKAHEEHWWA